MRSAPLLVGTLYAASLLATQASPFAGNWKLNIGKSVFHNQPAQKGFENIEASADDLVVRRVWTTAMGELKELTMTCRFDSKDRSIAWTADATHRSHSIRSKRLTERSFAITITHDEGEEMSVVVHEISADGKTMTVTTTALNDNGRFWKDVFIYERQ
jgi:hypothetical protein